MKTNSPALGKLKTNIMLLFFIDIFKVGKRNAMEGSPNTLKVQIGYCITGTLGARQYTHNAEVTPILNCNIGKVFEGK